MQLEKKSPCGSIDSKLFSKSKGFTLLEVMIAVSILAVGMLGIAAMHLMSLKDNRDAHLRSQAVLLTNDMAERMRSNKSQVYANAYDSINTANVTGAPAVSCFGTTDGCTPAQLTAIDIKQWSQRIRTTDDNIALLPAATGKVLKVAGSGNVFTIEISWQLEKSTASSYSIKIAI
jgi:type IV pilus assembly protein PilV